LIFALGGRGLLASLSPGVDFANVGGSFSGDSARHPISFRKFVKDVAVLVENIWIFTKEKIANTF